MTPDPDPWWEEHQDDLGDEHFAHGEDFGRAHAASNYRAVEHCPWHGRWTAHSPWDECPGCIATTHRNQPRDRHTVWDL